jgi:hypothetical protein
VTTGIDGAQPASAATASALQHPATEVASSSAGLGRLTFAANSPLAVALGAFVLSLLVRVYRLPDVEFARDQAVALWMELDALRQGFVPDHGLVSSILAYQPPGLVWLMAPGVLVGRGDPLAVMVWFAVLASLGVAVLVWTVARAWGIRLGLILGLLLATNPADALAPALLWHVSLYLGAVALFIAAAVQVRRDGSRWWAFGLGFVPIAYTLIHYSGLALILIALLLMVTPRWRSLILPAACGAFAGLLLWAPFALFEARVGWQDLIGVVHQGAADGPSDGIADRARELTRIVAAWGTGRWIEAGRVSLVVTALALVGLVYGLWRRHPLARVAAIVLLVGTLFQASAGAGDRADIGMLWNAALLALAALALASVPYRWLAALVIAGIVVGNLFIFDRVHNQFVARGETLEQVRGRAALGDAWQRSADDMARTPPETERYLASDPPVVAGTGSEVWYLREVGQPGAGRTAAAADALRTQAGR